jgi:hypothetical protein
MHKLIGIFLLLFINNKKLVSQNSIDSIVIFRQYTLIKDLISYSSSPDTISFFRESDPLRIKDLSRLSKISSKLSKLKPIEGECNNDIALLVNVYISNKCYILAFSKSNNSIYYQGACYKWNKRIYKSFITAKPD